MHRFAPALRRTARELDLPRPLRSAILLELAADLEAAYARHRRDGLDDAEAAERAETEVLGSREVVRRLSRLHADSWRGWSEGVGARLAGGADLALLGLAVVPMLLLAGAVAISNLLSGAASGLGWAILATGAVMVFLIGLETGRAARGRSAATGRLPVLLLLSMVAPAVGLLVLVLAGYSAAMALSAGAADAALQLELAERVGRGGALFAVGLLLGICGALSWFVLLNRAAMAADREVDALLDDGPVRGGDIVPLTPRRRA